MRFPALLSAKLARAHLAEMIHGAQTSRLVDFVDPAEVLHAGSAHPVSHGRIRGLLASPAPVLWIGGSEPLEHPGIAHFVRAIARSGRYVFLETSSVLLRIRIHEFQPVPQLFLAVRSGEPARSAGWDARKTRAFDSALEGIHSAKLSGFLISMVARIHSLTKLEEVAALASQVRSLDLDGLVITQAAQSPDSANREDAALQQKTIEARKLIGNRGWKWLSQVVEGALPREHSAQTVAISSPQVIERESEANEQGVRVA